MVANVAVLTYASTLHHVRKGPYISPFADLLCFYQGCWMYIDVLHPLIGIGLPSCSIDILIASRILTTLKPNSPSDGLRWPSRRVSRNAVPCTFSGSSKCTLGRRTSRSHIDKRKNSP